MKKRNIFLFVLLALVVVLAGSNIFASKGIYYCAQKGPQCLGLCGCETEGGGPYPYGSDPCCFYCNYYGEQLICCVGGGWSDGCRSF